MQERGEAVSGTPSPSTEVAEVAAVESASVDLGEVESAEADESEPDESARDTVARILRESTDADDDVEKKNPTSVNRKEPKLVQGKNVEKKESFSIPAPNRLTVEQKEAFHQLPDNLKRATHKMFQDQEAQYTKAVQSATNYGRESQHVVEAVRPYLLAHPELSEQGYTESRLVAALVAAHQRLTDPKTAKQTWLELGTQVGVDRDVLASLTSQFSQDGNANYDISKHPQFLSLQEKLNQVSSKIDGAEKQKFEGSVQRILSEMEAVREERDSSGRYLYPKLHDDVFLGQVKPLVSALVRALPGLNYGDALKRAYQTVEGQTGNSTQVSQTRFPGNNEQLARAQNAAVSVRGRSSLNSSPGSVIEIPKEALGSARESVRWALDQLRRGT